MLENSRRTSHTRVCLCALGALQTHTHTQLYRMVCLCVPAYVPLAESLSGPGRLVLPEDCRLSSTTGGAAVRLCVRNCAGHSCR